MLSRMTKLGVRLIAAAAILTFGPTSSQPLVAGSEDGGCLEEQSYACITQTRAYANKYCYSGGCITCNPEPEAVCTWCGHDAEHTFNPSNPPCGNN
jgi:hypothetical protein